MAALDQSPATGRKKQKRSAPRIDMTPMVDLAFLLLTFFVMTTTLNKPYALELQQPTSDATGKKRDIQAERVLNIVLGRNNEVFWYIGQPGSVPTRTDFSSTGIRKLLLQKNREIKDLFVFIKASDQSRYQSTIDILDEITIAQVANYSIVNLEAEDLTLIE